MSDPTWSAYPTLAPPWDRFPPPLGDDIWVRTTVMNLHYRVGKKCVTKHVPNPREPWHDLLNDNRLLQEIITAGSAAQAGALSDDQLRPSIDRWWALMEPLARRGIQGEGLVLRYEWALEGSGWERRLEPRWTIALPGGLQLVIGQCGREKELVTAYIPKWLIEFGFEERLAELARDLAGEYGVFSSGRLESPSPKRVLRYPQPYGVECRTRIRFLALERWCQIVL